MRRHDQPERTVLPTCEEESEMLRKDDTLAAEYDRRIDELDRHFDPVSKIESFIAHDATMSHYRSAFCIL